MGLKNTTTGLKEGQATWLLWTRQWTSRFH